MKLVRLVSLVALALLASAGLAQAQLGVAKRFVSFGIGGGMSVPVSDASEAFKNGFNAQGFIRFNPPALPVIRVSTSTTRGSISTTHGR